MGEHVPSKASECQSFPPVLMLIVIPAISELAAKVGSSVPHATAILMSVVRLHLRVKKDHVWWDDGLAVAGTVMDLLYMLTMWVKALDPQYELGGVIYYNAWTLHFPGIFVRWVTRISVWLSLARLYPPKHQTRRLALLLAAVFSVLGILCAVGGVMGCPGSAWGIRFQFDRCYTYESSGHRSQFEKIATVIGALDIICDAVLVTVPAYLLSRMSRIQRKRKIVIVFLCCGNVLTLLVILIAEIVYYRPFAETGGKENFINFLLHLSTATSLIAANLLIVGTAIYIWIERWMANRHSSAQRAPTSRRPTNSAANITYNSDLTRISTSGFGSTMTSVTEDEMGGPLDDEESRPLFWSLQRVEGRDEYELSAARRATV